MCRVYYRKLTLGPYTFFVLQMSTKIPQNIVLLM